MRSGKLKQLRRLPEQASASRNETKNCTAERPRGETSASKTPICCDLASAVCRPRLDPFRFGKTLGGEERETGDEGEDEAAAEHAEEAACA